MTWHMETCLKEDSEVLPKGTFANKILRDKGFNIAKNLTYDGYQRGLASVVYKFFDKKSMSLADKYALGGTIEIAPNKQLQSWS